MRFLKTFLISYTILHIIFPVLSFAKGPRVAVFDFDFSAIQKWWDWNWDIGKGISDMLVTELVNDGTYRVIERKVLDKILAEQDFSNSDRANPETAAKIGKILGVKYIIIGSITTFGTDTKQVGVGGVAWADRFGIGKIGTKKTKAKVVINARMIDIDTGEIVVVAKGVGESKRSGLLLGGLLGGRGGGGGMMVDMQSSDFRETILGEATEQAVIQLRDQFVAKASKLE
ncbi:MAG: CsgG/HfaB family protein [Candidatus Aminicenantia bacterium]